jgi:hypothetical protein
MDPGRIHVFLTRHEPKPFCDDCIAKELGLARRQLVQPITAALGLTTDYRKEKGTCSLCKSEKPITRSVRHA